MCIISRKPHSRNSKRNKKKDSSSSSSSSAATSPVLAARRILNIVDSPHTPRLVYSSDGRRIYSMTVPSPPLSLPSPISPQVPLQNHTQSQTISYGGIGKQPFWAVNTTDMVSQSPLQPAQQLAPPNPPAPAEPAPAPPPPPAAQPLPAYRGDQRERDETLVAEVDAARNLAERLDEVAELRPRPRGRSEHSSLRDRGQQTSGDLALQIVRQNAEEMERYRRERHIEDVVERAVRRMPGANREGGFRPAPPEAGARGGVALGDGNGWSFHCHQHFEPGFGGGGGGGENQGAGRDLGMENRRGSMGSGGIPLEVVRKVLDRLGRLEGRISDIGEDLGEWERDRRRRIGRDRERWRDIGF